MPSFAVSMESSQDLWGKYVCMMRLTPTITTYSMRLHMVAYLGVYDAGFRYPTLRFLEQVVQRSSCLEVIVLDSWVDAENDEQTSLNNFFVFLSTQVSFLSHFRLFMMINLNHYSILKESLNKLITAYFSAPTTHLQKIRITDAKIKSYQ